MYYCKYELQAYAAHFSVMVSAYLQVKFATEYQTVWVVRMRWIVAWPSQWNQV